MQTVCERRSGGLVHEAQNFEASEAASVFGGLALRIVEIRGNGDYGAVHRLFEIQLGPRFQFPQDECGNFRRREKLVAQANADDVFAVRIDTESKNVIRVRLGNKLFTPPEISAFILREL